MDVEFVIPLHKDDLLNGESGVYIVEEVLPLRIIPNKITACIDDLVTEGPFSVLQNFDVFFSMFSHFNEVESKLKERSWQYLLKALGQYMNGLSLVLEEGDCDVETRSKHLNTLKMLCYLLAQFMDCFEADATKPSTQVAPSGRGRAKSTASKRKTTSSGMWEWEDQRNEMLMLLGHLLQLDISRLWDPPVVEEEFVNLITGCCYKFLENPNVIKNKTTKDLMFNLLGIIIKKYNHGLGASLKIVQLLQHFEHLVQPLAQAVETFAEEFGAKSVVSEIIREIGRNDPRDLARDTSGTRSYAEFLVELSSRVPALILPSISVLLPHLDGESYSMRNGVLGVMGEIVSKVLSTEELQESGKKTRDQFLDTLEDHIHDTNAYVRSKALQTWLHLCCEKAIPLSRQHHLLELVIGRLKDKSSIVRKYAVQLLKNFLMHNPFGTLLPLEHLKEKLCQEKAKLKEMAPDQEQQVPAQAGDAAEGWRAIEAEVMATVQAHLDQEQIADEQGARMEIDRDAETALECTLKQIKSLLNQGCHVRALATLKAAMVTWPDCPAFTVNDTAEKENGEDENSENDETCKGKEKAEGQLLILRDIFLATKENNGEADELNPEALLQAAQETDAPSDSELVTEVSKQQVIVQYLQDYVDFQVQMEKCVNTVCQLLGSKSMTDVSEAVDFFVVASEVGLRNALVGVRRMLVLVWSRDSSVRDAVVEAYKRLYLDPPVSNQRVKTAVIVKNLMTLVDGASIGDLTSLEQLMVESVKGKLISAPVIKLLWERFAMKIPQTSAEESRAALVLLGMLAGAEVDIVRSNIDVLMTTGLGPRGQDDFLLARDTCVVLLKLSQSRKKPGSCADEPFRFSQSHGIFDRLTEIVVKGLPKLDKRDWTPMAEQAINVVYSLAEHPDAVCGGMIKQLAGCLLQREDQRDDPVEADSQEQGPEDAFEFSACQTGMLARFLTFVGHVALRQMIHLDVNILGEIKRRQGVQENEKDKHRQAKKAGRGKDNTGVSASKDQTSETIEEELGLTGATADDVEAEYIRKICEQELVTGRTLLASLCPLLVCICSNPVKFSDPNLRAAACLALAKFMMVSSEFCESQLQLLFTILEKSPQPTIRANTIVALGDLTFRFPNLLEPWTPHLYARLRDESVGVRKNTLVVLSHLILNDMVKIKGQISEVAMCLRDEDNSIADLAKLFFLELSKKGNAVYNILPDIISRLSEPDSGLKEEPFREIMRYLLSFIQKDKQSESLVEKLCHRLRVTRTDQQWKDLAFCLSVLPYNEKGVRKLQENFGCFHDKLTDDNVYQCFMVIVSKAKKFAKPELKVLVEELEQKITECHTKGMEDAEGLERAGRASGVVANTPARKPSRSRKGRTPATNKRRKKTAVSDEESGCDETSSRPRRTPAPSARSKRQAKSAKKRSEVRKMFESDDDDEMDLFDLGEEEEIGEESAGGENTDPNVSRKEKTTSRKGSRNLRNSTHQSRVDA